MKGNKAPERSHFTIMISRAPGKVRSFRISSKLLFGSILFLALLILGSFLCLYLYVDLLRTGIFQKELVEKAQDSPLNATNKTHAVKKHPEPAEEADRPKSDPFTTDKNRNARQENPAAEKAGNPLTAETGLRLLESGIPDEKVGIEKIAISRDGEKLSVRFRVTNESPSHQRIEGYVFAIAMEEENDQPGLWSYPKTPLQNGAPVEYKHGQRFSIINYRNMRGAYTLDSPDTKIRSINILVYNEKGDCILNKKIDAALPTAHPDTQG